MLFQRLVNWTERLARGLRWPTVLQIARARARLGQPRLFNAALGAPARQSSTSGNERKYGAHRGTDGGVGTRGFFKTLQEDCPWWMVDLSADWPIYAIRIHNRRGPAARVASGLRILLSSDGEQWEAVYASNHHFGDALSPGPLVIALRERKGGRFVKVELARRGTLALNQVEVLVPERHKVLLEAARHYGFDVARMTFRTRANARPYWVENAPRGFDGRLQAFHLRLPQGRFGNNLQQIGHAVSVAQHVGVQRVYVTKLHMLELKQPIRFGSVTALPDSDLSRDRPEGLLSGPFYYIDAFGRAGQSISARDIAAASRAVGQQALCRGTISPGSTPGERDLVIHLRAGDVFRTPHRLYVQPPLAFYRLCIAFARAQLGINRVVLVYEDEGNPCIPPLKAWLGEIGLPHVVQSRTLAEDLAVLLTAAHAVFGRGTFGPAVATLSSNLRTLFHSWLEHGFAPLPALTGVRLIGVDDVAGDYIKVGEWRNTPEQRRAMVDYPAEHLRLNPG